MEPNNPASSGEHKPADASWKDPRAERKVVALQDLIDAPKGNTQFKKGESFALHVLWEVPSPEAADELLDNLASCAVATHRDTPCVSTYIFHASTYDAEIASPGPIRVCDLPALADAQRKLRLGLRPAALESELARRRIDPSLLTAEPESLLPAEFAAKIAPVFVECTEVYLDEAAFMQHAHSRDYLAAYGKVMNPALSYKQPTTLRFGTPPESIVDRILAPILKEVVVSQGSHDFTWKSVKEASESPASSPSRGIYFSFDQDSQGTSASAVESITALSAHAVSLLTFSHPHRQSTVRTMCVVPISESAPHLHADVYDALKKLTIPRGAAFLTGLGDEVVQSVKNEFVTHDVSFIPDRKSVV